MNFELNWILQFLIEHASYITARTLRFLEDLGLILLNCPPKNSAGVSDTGEIRPNIKFAAFWVCVFDNKQR